MLKMEKCFADGVYHLIFEGETNRIKAVSFNQDTNLFYVTVILNEEKKMLDIYEVGDDGLILEFHDEKE